jgi:hypothetical protein
MILSDYYLQDDKKVKTPVEDEYRIITGFFSLPVLTQRAFLSAVGGYLKLSGFLISF